MLPKWNQRNHTIPSHSHRRPTEAEKGAGLDPIHCVSWFGPLKYSVQIYIYIHTYIPEKGGTKASIPSIPMFPNTFHPETLHPETLIAQTFHPETLHPETPFTNTFHPHIFTHRLFTKKLFLHIHIYIYIHIYIVFLTPGTKRLSPRPLRPILREMHHP